MARDPVRIFDLEPSGERLLLLRFPLLRHRSRASTTHLAIGKQDMYVRCSDILEPLRWSQPEAISSFRYKQEMAMNRAKFVQIVPKIPIALFLRRDGHARRGEQSVTRRRKTGGRRHNPARYDS